MELTADAIATAFNTINERKTWTARPNSRDKQETVHFSGQRGLVVLVYEVRTKTWYVRFNKYQAAWGDYITSIAKAFMAVSTTLKGAGLDFPAPAELSDVEIISSPGEGRDVKVRCVDKADKELRVWGEPVVGRFGGNLLKPHLVENTSLPLMKQTALESLLAQMPSPEEAAAQHQAMLDAGAKWDGMDGYDFSTPNPHEKSRVMANIMSDMPAWVGEADPVGECQCGLSELDDSSIGHTADCPAYQK